MAGGRLGNSRVRAMLECVLALGLMTAAVAGCADSKPAAPVADTAAGAPSIEAAKYRALAQERVDAMRPASPALRPVRPFTLRDSGYDGSALYVRDVDFRVTGEIGFAIHSMSATLVGTHPNEPIVFDDPESLTIAVHRGEVTLDDARLTAIFNRYIFGYRGSPLRNMRVAAEPGRLRITGEMNRGGWVPILLTGTLTLPNPRELVFHPEQVQVAGVAADSLMRAAHVRMADLLKVDTPVARLSGDDMVMQVARLTPPPALDMKIVKIGVHKGGVDFSLDDGTSAALAFPAGMPQQGMVIRGGDVKFMRSMPMNIDLTILPADPSAPFVLDLYRYREQMAAGTLNFSENGALTVRMPSATTLAAATDGTAIGSAAAQLNDTFLRRQQDQLAAARAVWREVPAAMRRPAECAAISPERCSPSAPPLIHVSNVDFFIAGKIGFHVRSLDAQMVPKQPGQPVDLDNPGQYDIHILAGEVVEPWPAMSALFNDYLLDYSPRSLNDLQLTADGDALRVTGGIKLWNHVPGVWLPTQMSGRIDVIDDRHIAFTPSSVKVLGVPQAGMLRALDIPLASLTPFARKGAVLRGNSLVFDQHTVFPPPVLQGRLASAKVTPEGLVLEFKREPDAPLARPPQQAGRSFVWIESGDIKMFNSLVVNGRTLIHDRDPDSILHFDLYGYRRDVANGQVVMDQSGALDVRLANPPPAGARPKLAQGF